MHAILKAIYAGVDFGSGTETTPVFDCLHVQYNRKHCRCGRPGNGAISSLSMFHGGTHDALQLETKIFV